MVGRRRLRLLVIGIGVYPGPLMREAESALIPQKHFTAPVAHVQPTSPRQ